MNQTKNAAEIAKTIGSVKTICISGYNTHAITALKMELMIDPA
jgi:hypothetical protein